MQWIYIAQHNPDKAKKKIIIIQLTNLKQGHQKKKGLWESGLRQGFGTWHENNEIVIQLSPESACVWK